MPFRLDVDLEDGYMSSGGIDDFNGQMAPGTCGHAKVCPDTGELHAFLSRSAAVTSDISSPFVRFS